MANIIRTIYPHGLGKKHFSLKFCVGSQVQHETLEEGQRMHRLKCCEYNNEDENNSPKIVIKIIKLHLRNLDKRKES